ncbi:hypothetical protein ACJX0J_026644, partial [Zea mays]
LSDVTDLPTHHLCCFVVLCRNFYFAVWFCTCFGVSDSLMLSLLFGFGSCCLVLSAISDSLLIICQRTFANLVTVYCLLQHLVCLIYLLIWLKICSMLKISDYQTTSIFSCFMLPQIFNQTFTSDYQTIIQLHPCMHASN